MSSGQESSEYQKPRRYYLDYNATSPMSSSVVEYLKSGQYLSSNPSSVHFSGKSSKRVIKKTKKYLMELFNLAGEFQTFFHSGATEGANSLLQGSAKWGLRNEQKFVYLIGKTDHSCVFQQKEDLEDFGHRVLYYGSKADGGPNWQEVEDLLGDLDESEIAIVHATWVNNETGRVIDLERFAKIKQVYKSYLVLDAVQSVGKVSNWKELSRAIDAYNFSGHKFGSMKGVGWCFVHEDFPFAALIRGGGQQDGLRSGTENTDGIYSIELALRDLVKSQNFEELQKIQEEFKATLKERYEGRLINISGHDEAQYAYTVFDLILEGTKADSSLMAFDLDGVDVSSGSACGSGALLPSRVLLAMGHTEEQAKSSIRISFPLVMSFDEYLQYKNVLLKTLDRLLS